MGIINRLGKIFQAEAHSTIDKLEDPIKMTEQGIRDLEKQLNESIHALAEVKALAIRSKNQANSYKLKAEEWHAKAVDLLNRAKAGQIDQAEAERLAAEALKEKNRYLQMLQTEMENYQKFQTQVNQLEANVQKIKQNINKWKNELKVLKARASVAKSTTKVNKELANIDSSSTVSMLERMKEKVEKQEALSEAYSEIALDTTASIDDEINKVLGDTDMTVASELEALKAQISGELPENKNNALPDNSQ